MGRELYGLLTHAITDKVLETSRDVMTMGSFIFRANLLNKNSIHSMQICYIVRVTLVFTRTYSFIQLRKQGLKKMTNTGSFDWSMGDGKERWCLFRAWGLNKKESKLRPSVKRMCRNCGNLSRVKEINVELMFPCLFYSLMV